MSELYGNKDGFSFCGPRSFPDPPKPSGFDVQIENGVFTYTYTGGDCSPGKNSGS